MHNNHRFSFQRRAQIQQSKFICSTIYSFRRKEHERFEPLLEAVVPAAAIFIKKVQAEVN